MSNSGNQNGRSLPPFGNFISYIHSRKHEVYAPATSLGPGYNSPKVMPEFEAPKSEKHEVAAPVWDPFEGFPLSTAVANLPSSSRETSAVANTRIDWKETLEAHLFKVDVPGLKKEEVKVEVEDGNILQISGERSKEQEEKNEKWHRTERSSGKFLRRFRLPENAKVEQVKAAMENGVLTVTVPRRK